MEQQVGTQSLVWAEVTENELPLIVQAIHARFPERRVFALHGPLGAGKTTLVKHFCSLLGIDETVQSPSFVSAHEYCGAVRVAHLDLFRLNKAEQIWQSGLHEYWSGTDYCFIEWPELAEPLLPSDTVHIWITVTGANSRQIAVTSC